MSDHAKIGFVLPSHGAFDYVRLAAQSFYEHTPNGFVILVDDASPDWQTRAAQAVVGELPSELSVVCRYKQQGGLTRSWNAGLRKAREFGCEYAIAGNSDLLFTPNWHKALIGGLEKCAIVGPTSNAPGVTSRGLQDIGRYYPEWQLKDDPVYLAEVASQLWERYNTQTIESEYGVNGFMLFSSVANWWRGAFDADCVFNPAHKFRMVRSEDELQGRWRRAGWVAGVCPGSFVWHYRSVSRGDKFKKPGWYRR